MIKDDGELRKTCLKALLAADTGEYPTNEGLVSKSVIRLDITLVCLINQHCCSLQDTPEFLY
jgi:hypothetical protein